VPWWASNPDTWTGLETLFSGLTCFPSLSLPSKLLPVPEIVSFTLTLVVSFEPSTTNSWAGQCRAAATRPHIFGCYISSRFWSTESVGSTCVYIGVNKSFVYPERFVNTVDLLNKLLLLWCCYLHPNQTSTRTGVKVSIIFIKFFIIYVQQPLGQLQREYSKIIK